jgi:hypothetical protein
VLVVVQNFLNQKKNMKVVLAGRHFTMRYQVYLKQKQTDILVIQELNIIVRNVVVTMDISSTTGQSLQAKDIVIMDFA